MQSLLEGHTADGQGTGGAARVSGCAYECPHFHQGLVKLADALGDRRILDHPTQQLPQTLGDLPLRLSLDLQVSGEKPLDVAINYGQWFLVGDGKNSSRRVSPVPRELEGITVVSGDCSCMLFSHDLGRTAQVAGAIVVAQAGPLGQDLVLL